ncbi:MAG: hypothetical protein HKN54_03025 [Flavobacteriaceae bacterium]|nr:hypothetical protein [Flavobacteriaceae bacterium]
MIKLGLLFLTVVLFINCDSQNDENTKNFDLDKSAINQSIEDWDKAWKDKDWELAIKHYSDKTDWTNAFGDRVQSKAELKELLQFIFNMDFVMDGKNNYGTNEISFLNDSIATVRSLNIRKNQKWADGSAMEDRYINHLRIYQKFKGSWMITDHMISQAWPKNPK